MSCLSSSVPILRTADPASDLRLPPILQRSLPGRRLAAPAASRSRRAVCAAVRTGARAASLAGMPRGAREDAAACGTRARRGGLGEGRLRRISTSAPEMRNGEGGIRTRDGVLTPYSLSRRVPSATRPPLPSTSSLLPRMPSASSCGGARPGGAWRHGGRRAAYDCWRAPARRSAQESAQRPQRAYTASCHLPRRGGRAVECGGLENRWRRQRRPGVRIPPPPPCDVSGHRRQMSR